MPLIVDIFNNDAFSAVELTRAINVVPNTYGRLQQLGLFEREAIATTRVAVQYNNGTLNLLPTRPRGGPPSLGAPEKRNYRIFEVFHVPHDDYVMPEDVQNIVALGGNVLDNVETHVNKKLMTMRRKHAITLEYMRWGALRGAILDYDGSTLLDLFTEFGISQKSINFALGTGTTNVAGKTRELVAYVEDNLLGETMSGVHVMCSPGFFEALITHAKVEDAYKYFASAQNPLRDDVRRGFAYHGATFEEHRGSAQQLNEDKTYTTRKFIPDNEAIAFPVGTMDTFASYFAPPALVTSEANMPPDEDVYVAQAIDPEFQRWVKLHSQSNPLPIVKRPALLVKLTLS